MRTKITIILSSEEVHRRIPYEALVGAWKHIDTFSYKRKLAEVGLTKEMLEPLYKKARKWALYTGVPQEPEFEPSELNLWDKVGQFIASL